MFYRFFTVPTAFAASVFFSSMAFADPSTLQGDVKGVDGRAAKGAEVRIARPDKKTAPLVVKTDAAGRFVANNLPAGNYMILATANGAVSPLQTVKLNPGKPALVSFDLRNSGASRAATVAKKKKRLVWVPAATGSRIGGGYEEVEDDSAASSSLKDAGSQLQRIQANQSGSRMGSSAGGQ